jgi:GLPGLI family protein
MKFIGLFLLALLSFSSRAQNSGRIIYEEKMDMHRNLPPERTELKDMIPPFRSSFWELVYHNDESIYQHQKEEDQEVTSTSGNSQMTMRFGGREMRVVYKHLTDSKMVDSRDFLQKQFLITGVPTERKWKIGKNAKDILGYHCMDASFQADSATHITAWFTPQIQNFNGPSDFQGLPGMILQIDINDGERVTTATQITLDSVDTSVIIAPTKGKEVTAEEFAKIREEKMKEMGMQGNGGPMQIMIRHN